MNPSTNGAESLSCKKSTCSLVCPIGSFIVGGNKLKCKNGSWQGTIGECMRNEGGSVDSISTVDDNLSTAGTGTDNGYEIPTSYGPIMGTNCAQLHTSHLYYHNCITQQGFDAGSTQKLCVITCASGVPIKWNVSCGYQCVKDLLGPNAASATLKCVCQDNKGNGCGWQLPEGGFYITQNHIAGLQCDHSSQDYEYTDGGPTYPSQPTHPSQPTYPGYNL